MKFSSTILSTLLVISQSNAFVLHPQSNHVQMAMRKQRSVVSSLHMSTPEDEIAALRAAAQKAREDAAQLEKALGKEVSDTSPKPKATTTATIEPTLSYEEVLSEVSKIDFTDINQLTKLNTLRDQSKLSLWNAAKTSSVNTNSPAPLRPYPLNLNSLEQRTGGKLTATSLGVSGEDDVSLDDFKNALIAVTLGCSALGVAALALLPGNIGATVCYFVALIPILFVAIGSSAPGIIAALIATIKGTKEEQDLQVDRICHHEAGHFLCGYLCGLPIRSYETNEFGYPFVEFHPATTVSESGEAYVATDRSYTEEEIAILSIVAMSGSTAEVVEFGQAKGGQNDLLELDNIFRKSDEFIGAAKQQDLTRWGALASYQIIMANEGIYKKLVKAFKEKQSIAQCIAAIEGQ